MLREADARGYGRVETMSPLNDQAVLAERGCTYEGYDEPLARRFLGSNITRCTRPR